MRTLRIELLQLLLILFFGFMIFGRTAEAADGAKRVLFISSYSYAWEQVQLQIEGIRAGLGEDVVLDYEFMDTKRVDTEESLQLFYEGLAYRLSVVEPYDAVILGDDAALRFAMEHQEDLFPEIPMVFEGVNDEELAAEAVQNPMIAGVLEKLSVEKNIELGLKINPKAKRVVAILDDSLTGEAERKRYYKCAEQYPNLEFDELNVSQSRNFTLRYALGSLSEDTILIYIIMTEDIEGRTYTDRQAIDLITECATVPALRMVDGGIGTGLLGGNMVSMRKSGEIAAQMAMEIMAGKPADSFELVTDSPQTYCVDALVMDKFHISMSVLPKDTEIINKKTTFFERNKEAMVPFSILGIVVVVVLGWALFDNFKRRHLMVELEGTKKLMESASQHDFLTGIPNRSKFMSDIERLVGEKKPCTVIMIDIDDFKSINDTLGHTAGDEALKQVASRLRDMESQLLTPYRFAGDEFILILESAQYKIVEKTAYQCRQVFTSPFILDGKKSKVCGSIGIASYPKDSDDVEKLIVCADDAMYQVKKNGKNDFAFYSAQQI
ncbi:MAG: GGDEF domain-containing protein [Butyrivibrio sp.]|nr:GGDEF domain-containing protein [Acetatifactor muris]MCM1559450.1 GGDEF domain-containing protein [Butyrivibrio sp.]